MTEEQEWTLSFLPITITTGVGGAHLSCPQLPGTALSVGGQPPPYTLRPPIPPPHPAKLGHGVPHLRGLGREG